MRFNRVLFAVMLGIFLPGFVVFATIEPQNYFCIDTGYRWDKISNRAVLYGDEPGVRSVSQIAKGLNSFLLGGKGRGTLFNTIYGKAMAHYGWMAHDGAYKEEGSMTGGISGHTVDATVAAGYLFPFGYCWGIAPLVGWSYDKLHVKGKHVHAAILGVSPNMGNISYKSRFQGPWIGFDLLFQPNCLWDFTFGYEWHYARWHGSRILSRGDLGISYGTTTGFSNVRDHHHLIGNVFSFEGSYIFRTNWSIGFGLRYQNWKSSQTGHYKRTTTPLDPAFTSRLITDVSWDSFSATGRLGYIF